MCTLHGFVNIHGRVLAFPLYFEDLSFSCSHMAELNSFITIIAPWKQFVEKKVYLVRYPETVMISKQVVLSDSEKIINNPIMTIMK